MLATNKGVTLIEGLIASAILGITAIAYITFQSTVIQERSRSKALDIIADASRVIHQNIKSRASCNLVMKANPLNTSFTEIPRGITDPTDINRFEQKSASIVAQDLGHGVRIEGHEILREGDRFYLETTFNLDSDNKKELGVETVRRRFLMDVQLDVNGVFEDCISETSNIIKTPSTITCRLQDGTIDPNSDMCNTERTDPPPNPTETLCAPGASYTLEQDANGLPTLKCQNCVPQIKFIKWRCQKGGQVGISGANWINVCYYKAGCVEDGVANFGPTFFTQGPTSASGGDTGTKKNCKKKRDPCPGEQVAYSNAEQVAIETSITAKEEAENTQKHFNLLKQYDNANNASMVQEAFADLKVAADEADYAANRCAEAAEVAKTDKANEALKVALEAQEKVKQLFKDAVTILSKYI